jgi:hypothetical protein
MTRRHIALLILLTVAGCGEYDPPIQGDHTADRYKTDLEACRKTSSHAVYLKNAAAPGTWIISPIIGPPKVRAAIRACMQAKGYQLEKPES